jgi:hypothetical protein
MIRNMEIEYEAEYQPFCCRQFCSTPRPPSSFSHGILPSSFTHGVPSTFLARANLTCYTERRKTYETEKW